MKKKAKKGRTRKASTLSKDIATFEAAASAIVKRIGEERDKLSSLLEEYNDILDSSEQAMEAFEDGLLEISRYL